jgi:hypothetical protein
MSVKPQWVRMEGRSTMVLGLHLQLRVLRRPDVLVREWEWMAGFGPGNTIVVVVDKGLSLTQEEGEAAAVEAARPLIAELAEALSSL